MDFDVFGEKLIGIVVTALIFFVLRSVGCSTTGASIGSEVIKAGYESQQYTSPPARSNSTRSNSSRNTDTYYSNDDSYYYDEYYHSHYDEYGDIYYHSHY